MTDYYVSVGDREYQVKIEKERLSVDGEPLDVSLTPLNGSGMQLLRRNQQTVEMYFYPQDGSTYQVQIDGYLVQALVRSKASAKAGKPKAGRKEGQEGALTAPMPGLIVEIAVKPGEQVEKGQLLAVVESMKMQMQMRSAVAGRITKIPVKPGDQIQKGQLLVLVCPDERKHEDSLPEVD